jgi:hypothetical protein
VLGRRCENNIINIEKKISSVAIVMKSKEGSARTRRSETDCFSISRKTLKPSPWCLFETTETFLKKTNMIRI